MGQNTEGSKFDSTVSVNLLELMKFPREGIFSTVVAKSSVANHTLMCLGKGSAISDHTSTRDAAVYVIKGNGTFFMNNQAIAMKPGVLIFMPANTVHRLSAEEDVAILLSLSGSVK